MRGSGSSKCDLCPHGGLSCTFERKLACLRANVVKMSIDELMREGWLYATTLARLRILSDIGAGEKRDIEVAEGFKILLDVVNRELARRGHSNV